MLNDEKISVDYMVTDTILNRHGQDYESITFLQTEFFLVGRKFQLKKTKIKLNLTSFSSSFVD